MDFRQAIFDSPGLVERLSCLFTEPLPDTPVLTAKVKLLWQCNLSCRYCLLPKSGEMVSRHKAASFLTELKKGGLRKVHFSGGEVFLHPEVFSILEDACTAGLQVNLTTNGTLLDRTAVHLLSGMGVHSITVSLDGPTARVHEQLREKKGAFKATVKALHHLTRLVRKGLRVRVNTVATSMNALALPALYRFLKEEFGGGLHWKIIPVDGKKSGSRRSFFLDEETVRSLAQESAGWDILEESPFAGAEKCLQHFVCGRYGAGASAWPVRCWMPWLHLFMDPDGFCYPCCAGRGKMAALGRFPDLAPGDIVKGTRSAQLRMAMASGLVPGMCSRCDDFTKENDVIRELTARPATYVIDGPDRDGANTKGAVE